MASSANMLNLITQFRTLTEKPTDFLTKNEQRSDSFKSLAKTVFDHVRDTSINVPHSPALTELLTGVQFDDEQVWQQLELDNNLNIAGTVKSLASVLVQGEPEFFGVASGSPLPSGALPDQEQGEEESGIESHEEEEEEQHQFENTDEVEEDEDEDEDDEAFAQEDENGEEEEDEEEEDEEKNEKSFFGEEKVAVKNRTSSGPASSLDDEFFKLSEMNEFLLEAEKGEGRGLLGGEEIDYFAKDETSKARKYRYDDFFDPKPSGLLGKPVGGSKVQSTFEKRQEKLQTRIGEMEAEAVAEKPWQLKGEISAQKRPENSLLEEYLEFDHVTRHAPLITEEVSLKLEDVILQRVKNSAFDDVERKNKEEKNDPFEFKKKLVLEERKNKKSLSQLYEEEYLKKMAKEEKTENLEQKKITKNMEDVFLKLDALSNFHFIPKKSLVEVQILNNLPTFLLEEIQPLALNSSVFLAPEEVLPKKKGGALVGGAEASGTDKKRSRRKKKLRQKMQKIHLEEKTQEEMKRVKKVEKGKTKSGSSGAFFDKLQDTVRAEQTAKGGVVDGGKESKKRKKNVGAEGKSVKKFKL